MEISHIIRGEEWIPSTPKHVILYNLLGWEIPKFAHLPLLTNEQKAKLSKRHGDVAVEDFLAKGYLPEALLNFIALLGWNPGNNKELFSLDELIKNFKLEKVQKGSAVFDREKLNWMNSQYIKNKKPNDLVDLVLPFLNSEDYFDEKLFDVVEIIKLFQERLDTLEEIGVKAKFLYQLPDYEAGILIFKKSNKETTLKALENSKKIIQDLDNIKNTNQTRDIFDTKREELGLTRAEMFWPLRVAVSGLEQSPDVFDIIAVLGKEAAQKRIQTALEKLLKM